ncbi:MAG TPA: radical SAM protein [Candidatus Bathyarchaeia archaeon]|nr:radical SAM protein [Candidatus Bathyarchaeia archaeon]
MYEVYSLKRILNVQKHCDGGWFWTKYSAYPYTGCEYGCAYCYSREEKYNRLRASGCAEPVGLSDPFSEHIMVKENAPELLEKELRRKPRDLIYLDSYQPVEREYRYARKVLEICLHLGFPVFINEKSPLLLRDLDILQEISEKSYLNVGWSIISTSDDTGKLAFEPKTPSYRSRFEAMKKLAEVGILTGTVFMPILPFVCDSEENIRAIVEKTKECCGKYVLDAGLTLNGNCKTHFFKAVERLDPQLLEKYRELYGDPKALVDRNRQAHQLVLAFCMENGLSPKIPRPVKIYPKDLQVNKRIAETFYLEARELQIAGQERAKEWAYRRAAWSLDDLEESVREIIRKRGADALLEIEGIGKSLADRIAAFLQENCE